MGYINAFGGGTVQSSNTSYTLLDITVADITLQWPQAFQDTANVVYDYMNITSGARVGGTITIPAANQSSVGISFVFNNIGGNAIQIRYNSGANLQNIAGGAIYLFYLTDNTTQNGVWSIIPFGGGAAGVINLSLVQPAAGLTINPAGVQTGAIVETFALANALASIQNLATTGYGVRSAVDTWVTRTIVSGNANIAIANGNGVAGNTSITLNNALVGLTSVNVGTMTLNANTITGTQLNQNLVITPNGTGEVQISSNENIQSGNQLKFYNAANTFYTGILGGNAAANTSYTLPLTYPLTNGQVLASTTAGIMSWSNVVVSPGATTTNAIAKYLNTTGQLANTAIIIDNLNNITAATSAVIGNIGIGAAPSIAGTTAETISSIAGSDMNFRSGTGLYGMNGTFLSLNPRVPGTPMQINFFDGASTNFVSLKSQAAAMVASIAYTLPNAGPTTAGQFLTSTVPAAGLSTMSWAVPQGLVFITTLTAANSATIDFTNAGGTFPVFNSYVIVVKDLIPVTNDTFLYLKFYIGGVVINAGYNYSFTSTDAGGGGPTGANLFGAAAAQIAFTKTAAAGGLPDAATVPNASFNGVFTIVNPQSANFTAINGLCTYVQSNGAYLQNNGGGMLANANAVNGIRFLMSAGNISSGTFSLYGLSS